MIARQNRFSHFRPLALWGPVELSTTSKDLHASNQERVCWAEAFGEMLRTMSEFLMLATSRSPAQWMTLAAAQENASDPTSPTAIPDAPANHSVARVRVKGNADTKHTRRG